VNEVYAVHVPQAIGRLINNIVAIYDNREEAEKDKELMEKGYGCEGTKVIKHDVWSKFDTYQWDAIPECAKPQAEDE